MYLVIEIQTSVYSAGPGNLNVSISGDVNLNANGKICISAFGDVDINTTTGQINLGNNAMKNLVNNLPVCLVCGAQHCIGNTQVNA